MRPAYYEEMWRSLRNNTDVDIDLLESLAQRIASSFVDRYFYSDEYHVDYIRLLCEMATHYKQPELDQIAAKALFGIVIERLCDDFEELQTETYNRLICQVVSFLRRLPEGSGLDVALNGFHLETEDQLYQRIESIRLSPDLKLPPDFKPKKVLILSRVTIGADVAITSVICQRIARKFPQASIVVTGNTKLDQIFSLESGIEVRQLDYARRGGLLERFQVWLNLLDQVRSELTGLVDTEYLVIDPDSRLTQLGVLPLVGESNYRFFNSRGKQGYPIKASISELTNLWMDHILGQAPSCYPAAWPPGDILKRARDLRNVIDPGNKLNFIAMNFGVGGNGRKMVEGDFESRLALSLLEDPAVRIILDLGFGTFERERSEAILQAARMKDIKTQQLTFGSFAQLAANCRLIGIECSIAEISALIAVCDEFIGYDSACQHIAAAQGVRTFTVFAGTNNVRFIRRWRACGPTSSEIIYVDTISKENLPDNREIVERIMDLRSSDQDPELV